jgi:SAM-dependent methyltransferase
MTYSEQFYDIIRDGATRSANIVGPLVLEQLNYPRRIADIGCGQGIWSHWFAENGCQVVGVDGDYVRFIDPFENLRFVSHDLREPIPDLGKQDLVVSLEVAEHLPADRADSFVAELCSLAPLVLFSAAIPGQGGAGHLNEQWPEYWVSRFRDQGFEVSGALRWRIWGDDRVENWYRQNLLVAVQRSQVCVYPELFDTPVAYPWPVVHPVLYDARRPQ